MKHSLAIFLCLWQSAVLAQFNEISAQQKIQVLIASYPKLLSHTESGYLIAHDGRRWLIEDGTKKSFQEKLNQPDIADSLEQNYPLIACQPKRLKDFDPGRIRYTPLLKALYGEDAKRVKAQLTQVKWFAKPLYVNKMQQVDLALKAVKAQIEEHPELVRFVSPSAGVFNWRVISGTKRLSVHSFGAAIDLNIKYAHYWKWTGKSFENKKITTSYPRRLIAIFEDHGFIWGGQWYHYDTMHFEYRPELIEIAKQQGCMND